MTISNPPVPASVLVVCLCADWCGVCREYRSRFDQVQLSVTAQFPQARFLWIDVEDEADSLDLPDVENFPALLLAVGAAPRFFGPVTPQAATLERLIRMQIEDAAAPVLADPELVALVARIRAGAKR
jgi:thiol-disulfide isomerase/thioredoxin